MERRNFRVQPVAGSRRENPISLRHGDFFARLAFAARSLSRPLHLQTLLVSRRRFHSERHDHARRASARTKRALDLFPKRQTLAGYFLSQDGEWDSNGEAIWAYHRYLQLTGETCPEKWLSSIEKGADWILKKRLPRDSGEPHAGLLPAGFSAEHLGPNDYYYWDNFWGVAGLRCAAELLRATKPEKAKYFSDGADEYLETIVASFKKIPDREARGAISASPHRRMDAGAVGSLVADFPLQLFPPGETRILKTAAYLLEHSFFDGGFFQNMIHSGINAYLTIHLAQVLLRAGDIARAGIDRHRRASGQSHRTMAGSDSSADQRRLHGRRPTYLGGGGMGVDDSQLVCARRKRPPHRRFRGFPALVAKRKTIFVWPNSDALSVRSTFHSNPAKIISRFLSKETGSSNRQLLKCACRVLSLRRASLGQIRF